MPTLRRQPAQRGFVHVQITANLAGSQMFRLLETPLQSWHLSFLILLLSFTLKSDDLMAYFGQNIT